MFEKLQKLYDHFVLGNPVAVLLILLAVFSYFGFHARDFKLDASADSLLLDNDPDLRAFKETESRYGIKEFLIVTYTPEDDLFSPGSLEIIKQLRGEFRQLERVESVVSLIDVPLVNQGEGSLSELSGNIPTLESEDIDIEKARRELVNSPIYRDLIISRDGQTTAIQINLRVNKEYRTLQKNRDRLLAQREKEGLNAEEQQVLKQVLEDYDRSKTRLNKDDRLNIEEVRAIIQPYRQYGTIHLGGVPMIADDMITFIKNDLVVFGTGVFLFLIGMLATIFRRMRWVLLPLSSCVFAGLSMIGLLGLIGWRVTVISSNFISLMLIITMSMNIHLIVRYRQLTKDFPEMDRRTLVLTTVSRMIWPCLYTTLTTIMAFGSLVVSNIKPVIDFGWMMTIGLTITLLISFLLFPALLMLMGKSVEAEQKGWEFQFTTRLASVTEHHGNKILVLAVLLVSASLFGTSRLRVENSFLNYFKSGTEIYQGLKQIDEKLGGTTPLDILLDLTEEEVSPPEDDELSDLFGAYEEDPEAVWFTAERLNTIKEAHDYLDSIPAVGKVLSLASIIRVGETLNKGKFDSFELAIAYKRFPPEYREVLLDPYISMENNEARISIRVMDSLPDLRRKELIEKIHLELTEKLGLSPNSFKITGVLVLYNNMLQSLFRSQILTLAIVIAGIALMLFILFRSISLAIIGIIPNVLAAVIILGMMGLLSIPLDIMTTTIAAITIGIAVDNSIHYLYRFREEYPRFRNYKKTMYYCHANIGKAMFYTMITIVIGFSILVLSNFIPTIYFGFLTALAMLIALLATLTLLPRLILLWKPF